jgi:outer membrane lipoprotein SlyB
MRVRLASTFGKLYQQEIFMRYSTRFVSAASSVLALVSIVACAPMNPPGPVLSYPATYPVGTYPAPINQGAYIEYGRVSNVEVVRMQQPGAGSGLGAVIGGVAGAVVGSQIGAGSGRTAATVIGAVGGAVAGNAIERSRAANTSAGESYRVSVQMDNGPMRAYDMSSYGDLRIGDRVRIENGQVYRAM